MSWGSFRPLGLSLSVIVFLAAALVSPPAAQAGAVSSEKLLRILPTQAVALVLTADPDVIPTGECSVLRWEAGPPDYAVYLNGEPVMPRGEREVCPKSTVPYSLVALTPDGPKAETILLRVGEALAQAAPTSPAPPGAPSVQFYAVPPTISSGACADLRWSVAPGDLPVRLEGQPSPPAGTLSVCPSSTRSYRLHVEAPPAAGGPREFTVTVQVGLSAPPKPVVAPTSVALSVQFFADPLAIPSGGCSDLRWSVTPGDWPVKFEGQSSPPAGTLSVCPSATRSYRLHVEAPPESGGPRDFVETVQVGPPAPPPVAPTPPPPPAGSSGADITPTDLFPDNQPHGQMWARITNNGPDTLVNKHVWVQGQANAFPPGSGNVAIPYLWGPKEYTLNLKPGETATFNLGWPVDNSSNRWEFSVTAKAKDFTDPRPGNDTYHESLTAVGGPPAGQPPGPPGPAPAQPAPDSKTVDLAVTDLYPPQPQGNVWLRVTNNGPATLNNVDAEFKCGASGTPIGGSSPNWSHVEAPWTAKLTLKPGETKALQTQVIVDLTQSTYEAFCAVRVLGGYTDPNVSNDKYTETIAAAGGPPAPGGGAPPGPTGADITPIDLIADDQPHGHMSVRILNNGPATLVNKKVVVNGQGNSFAPGGGNVAIPYLWSPKEFTVNLKPGDTAKLDLGWQVDNSTNRWEFSVTAKAKDFTDPNPNNDTHTESLPAVGGQPGGAPPGGGSAGPNKADLAVTDIFPQSMPKGEVYFRITNNGPSSLSDRPVNATCEAKIHSYVAGAPGPNSTGRYLQPHLTLNPGQTEAYDTGLEIDTSQNWYDITCKLEPGDLDLKPGNNTYSEKIPPPP